MAARARVIGGPVEPGDQVRLVGPRIFTYRGTEYRLKSDPKDRFTALEVGGGQVKARHDQQQSVHSFYLGDVAIAKKGADRAAPRSPRATRTKRAPIRRKRAA